MIEEVTIKFSTPKIGLDKVEIAVPQPATNYISEMWKNTPLLMPQDKQEWDLFVDKNIGEDSRKHTAKTCPSFIDIWMSGYVVPAPCDIWMYFDKKTNLYQWETSMPQIELTTHPNMQLLEHGKGENDWLFTFKLDNVWFVETPKGYSIYQVPMLWHDRRDYEVAYGVIHTDMYHQLNIQILVKKQEIMINQGDPLCYIVPYKRLKHNHEIVPYDEEKIMASNFRNLGRFKSMYLKNFNRMEKNREKD